MPNFIAELRHRLDKYKKKVDEYKRRVEKLENRRTEVGKERGRLNRIVAKKLCRNFADKFHLTLPPELREMVYNYVWDGPMLHLVFNDVTGGEMTVKSTHFSDPRDFLPAGGHPQGKSINIVPWSIPCTQDACRCFQWWKLPFWVQHQYVGMDVAVEVAKAYYRNALAFRLGPKYLEDLTGMLSQDHFHLGIKPADHIRRLEIPLHPHAWIEDDKKRTYRIEGMHGLDVFQRRFEVLLDVRVKLGFHLIIRLLSDGFLVDSISALERSRSVVNKLLEEGATVTVLASDTLSDKEHDVTDYYMLSLVDWQKKWTEKISEESPSP
jgi:hypothetical protein